MRPLRSDCNCCNVGATEVDEMPEAEAVRGERVFSTIPSPLYAKLREIAERRYMSEADAIRAAIRAFVENEGQS